MTKKLCWCLLTAAVLCECVSVVANTGRNAVAFLVPHRNNKAGRSTTPPTLAATPTRSQLDEERISNARRLMTVNKDNWKEVVHLWTDDATYREPSFTLHGEEELATFLRKLFLFVKGDYQFEIEEEVYQEDTYMCYWRMYGSFEKAFIWNFITISETFDAKGLSIMKFRPNEARCYFHHDIYTEGDLWKNVIFIGNVVEYLRKDFRQSVTNKASQQ